MNTQTRKSSHFAALTYPACLEIRIIAHSQFDCGTFLKNTSLNVKECHSSNSRSGKFKTWRVEIEFPSYQSYLQLRTALNEHKLIEFVL